MDSQGVTRSAGLEHRRPLDEPALHRTLLRMRRAESPPWLHLEVARRMAERLPIIKLKPRVVLDWSARLGGGRRALESAYAADPARPNIVAVEPVPAAPGQHDTGVAGLGYMHLERPQPVPWWSPARWRRPPPAPLRPDQVQPGLAQLVWSNMALHGEIRPELLISQWHRALATDGFLMFSTLGPGSLPELRTLYGAESWGPAMAPLVDMHDVGDMLVAAGFADPVMDQELIVLTWPDARAALLELRSLGANIDPKRHAGLRTPRWRSQLTQRLQELASQRDDRRLALTFEVVYGHAFRPPERLRATPEARVSLEEFRAMTRERRR